VTGAKVIASGIVRDPDLDRIDLQRHRPERLLVPGVPGFKQQRLFFLVSGEGEVKFRYESLKGGVLGRGIKLEEPSTRKEFK
jgi:hypothetical protein